ncbi:MAG: redoxin domain-containing protein [Bacteroidetes bacterium]|nr:redoxin domain-containing protein [Bacteroidota bacterium]
MRYLLTSLLCVFTLGLTAQLPNGSVAPDFTATDITGVEYNLYDLLDEGNTVILNFGATWTGPVWNYAQIGVLQDLYSVFGPEGTGDLYVFFLESDDTTTDADLNGNGPATTGDWVSIINYPIIDNASNVFDSYSNSYYPTIYTVCPDGVLNENTNEMEYTLVESGQASFDGHVTAAFMDCENSITGAAPLMSYNGETSSCGGGQWMASTSVNNLGSDDVTAMIFTAELNGVAQDDITWGGVLSNGDNTTIDLGAYNETGTFDYSLVSVNGADWNAEEAVNIIGSTDATSYIQVRITTDNWPEETGWTIESASGMYIDGVATGELAGQANTEFTWDVALNLDECYVFTMTDTYGDGLYASQWGDFADGSAQIIDLGNVDSVIWFVEGDMEFAEIIFGMNVNLEIIIDGCMDITSCNYSPEATIDDDSCLEFDDCGICGGDGSSCIQTCLDDDDAVSAVGGCINAVDLLGCAFYWDDVLISELCPESCNNCPCDNDFNDNGVCDDVEVFSCTYPDAINYNALATADNGSCVFETTNACPADLDGNGVVATQDLLSFLSLFGESCL